MPPDILALLSSLGVSGQVIGYVAMSISIATVLVRYLPKPAGNGIYAVMWRVMTSVANLKLDSNAASADSSSGKLHSAAVALLLLSMAVGVSACSAQGGMTQQAQQLAVDVELIAGGMQAVLPEIQKIHGVPPGTIEALSKDVAQVQADAAAINAALSAHTALPATRVQEIASILGTVATAVLPGIPNGVQFVPVVQAAQALVPELLAAAGIAAQGHVDGLPEPALARMVLAGQMAR